MFEIELPRRLPEVEALFDRLLEAPFVKLPEEHGISRSFGVYTRPLKDMGVLDLYRGYDKNETIAILKVNNFYKPNNVKKKIGRKTKYLFDDLLIPRL